MGLWDAVLLLNQCRVLTPRKDVPLPLLQRMASLGYCYQSGLLFHVLPPTDRMAVVLKPQLELFA